MAMDLSDWVGKKINHWHHGECLVICATGFLHFFTSALDQPTPGYFMVDMEGEGHTWTRI